MDLALLDSDVGAQGGFDVATYVAAAAFNNAALPPDMPDWLKAVIEARAEEFRAGAGSSLIFDELSEAGAKEKRRKDADERVDAQAGVIMQQQQRDRDEWAQASHTLAGQTMTGTEWREMAEDLKSGGKGNDWLLAYLAEHGKTEEEAKQIAKDMHLAAKAMSKPVHDRTAAEQAALNHVEENPISAKLMHDYKDAKAHGFPPVAQSTSAFTNTDRAASTEARATALEERAFTNAPDLTAQYRTAMTATVPLDAQPKLAVATPAPQPGMAAGLDG